MFSCRALVIVPIATLCMAGAAPARAQLNTQHVRGSFGVKAGSAPPPGAYYIAPLLYFYSTDDVRKPNGDRLSINANIDAALFGAGASVVTKKTILGASYGFSFLVAGANNRLQATEIDANPGAGITDTVLTPLSLGWHKKRADATAYYTLYIPTGRYEDGASNNTGMGMWGQDVGFGTTVYLTEDRKFHAASVVTFTFSSKKEDSDTKPGNLMTLEGGLGGDFLGGGLTAGLAYYYSTKMTSDQLDTRFPLNIQLAKANVFALGPDITLALASKKTNTVYGFLTVRYEWELHAEAQTKGGMWLVQAVFPFKPIHLPTP
jgi:hypothetical protein